MRTTPENIILTRILCVRELDDKFKYCIEI